MKATRKKTKAAAAVAIGDPTAGDDRQARSLVTPEGVDLKLRLGDAGERAAALLIDLLIMLGVSFLMLLVINAIQAWSRRFV